MFSSPQVSLGHRFTTMATTHLGSYVAELLVRSTSLVQLVRTMIHSATHTSASRVADTPPLVPISRYSYRLFVVAVSLLSKVLQQGGDWPSSGSGSMYAYNNQV